MPLIARKATTTFFWPSSHDSCGLIIIHRRRHAVIEVDKDMLADEGDFDD
jgi:hypothetical protein